MILSYPVMASDDDTKSDILLWL